jgi:hypothetical protein
MGSTGESRSKARQLRALAKTAQRPEADWLRTVADEFDLQAEAEEQAEEKGSRQSDAPDCH